MIKMCFLQVPKKDSGLQQTLISLKNDFILTVRKAILKSKSDFEYMIEEKIDQKSIDLQPWPYGQEF